MMESVILPAICLYAQLFFFLFFDSNAIDWLIDLLIDWLIYLII